MILSDYFTFIIGKLLSKKFITKNLTLEIIINKKRNYTNKIFQNIHLIEFGHENTFP